jgi:glycosyltransferase involved in cell wall biosynthesis
MRAIHVAATRNSESSAAWRILSAQRQAGIDAIALVHKNNRSMPNTELFPNNNPFLKYSTVSKINSALRKFTHFKVQKLPWSYNFFSESNTEVFTKLNPDIVNIHWMPSVIDVHKLSEIKKPIVITLHDVWPLTGGCHCNLDCNKWRTGCSSCPQNSLMSGCKISANNIWIDKKEAYKAIDNLSVVAPSHWIASMAQQSPFFENRKISVIKNCADSNVFNFDLSKKNFGRKTKLLYVVSGAIDQHHKGFDLLVDVLGKLERKENFQVVIVGESGSQRNKIKGVDTIYLENIKSQVEMSDIYKSIDLMISTSRQDNLPNTLIEASMCGIPVAAFDIGGISDIVVDDLNGKLFSSEDTSGMALYIDGLAFKELNQHEIAKETQQKFAYETCAREYKKHYNKVLQGQ